MPEIPRAKLKTGGKIPILGFGTWKLKGEKLKRSIHTALEAGYTHLDTAEGYLNEEEVGEAIKDYDRDKLFLTSKVLPSNLNYDYVLKSCRKSLEKLETSYLDLYLIHWPNPTVSLRETLQAFKKLYESGKVRNLGVSNFNTYQLKVANRISEIPISVNQVEFHPWYHDEMLLSYCKSNEIFVTASSPLARTKVLKDPLINKLANKYDKTPAQIVLRWEIQRGAGTIPKSSTPAHIKDNREVFDFELEPADVKNVNSIRKEKKIYMIDLDDEIYGIAS